MKEELIKRFQGDIMRLERELKSELPKEIKRARELGDLRENAEYQAAKDRQSFVQARLSMLHKRVAELQLMNLDRIPKDRASFGSTVHVLESDSQTVVYQLVLPEDADPDKGWISTASPIGRALMGKEEGDEVSVPTPNGTREFEIVKLVRREKEPTFENVRERVGDDVAEVEYRIWRRTVFNNSQRALTLTQE